MFNLLTANKVLRNNQIVIIHGRSRPNVIMSLDIVLKFQLIISPFTIRNQKRKLVSDHFEEAVYLNHSSAQFILNFL